MPCQCRAKLRIVGERVETRREGRKARQSPDHEPETGGESRSGTHNPLVVGSSPTRPTTLYCRAAPSSGTHASAAFPCRWHTRLLAGFSFCCLQRGRSYLHPSVLLRLFAVPVLTGFHHPGRDVPFRAGRCPWNPEAVQGAEDPWRGQGLCRESPQVGVSLAYFVPIFCPRIAGCCADIPRNHFREDTMIIPDRGISSIFFFSRFASGQKSRILHRWNVTLGVLLFQEYSLQWPH